MLAVRREIKPIILVLRIAQRVVHNHRPVVDALFVLVQKRKDLRGLINLPGLRLDEGITSSFLVLQTGEPSRVGI